jgi:MoaA/NifB/PqqE/SkfB family radical SAM enzyme
MRPSPCPALQIELTTRCNFDCFYCAGRDMRQGDMPGEVFEAVLARHVREHGIPECVSLQGEGEPTLHPDFFHMAQRVREMGSRPYTITNGTYRHPERFIGLFTRVGVSVDTLDESAARRIGRHNLPRVLGFVAALAPHLQIVIHSIARSAATTRIAAWCRVQGYEHIVQPLQTKGDYSYRYAKMMGGAGGADVAGPFWCSYLARPAMRYYSLDATELPCCFIKDTTRYPGMAAMMSHQESGNWPECCRGCRYGRGHA